MFKTQLKPRRTQRHPHVDGHVHHGPSSDMSERKEEVTEDAGLRSGWEKENRDKRQEKSREMQGPGAYAH